MEIKRVDNKPIVIHTKEKPKLHMHKAKNAAKKEEKTDKSAKNRQPDIRGRKKFSFKRSKKDTSRKQNAAIHQTASENSVQETAGDKKELTGYKQRFKQSRQSIKRKKAGSHAARAGAAVAVSQLEGGEEIKRAAFITYEMSQPVTRAASKGAVLYKEKIRKKDKKGIKQACSEKRISKKPVQKGIKKVDSAKKKQRKSSGDKKGGSNSLKSRGMRFFFDKLKSGENQQESFKNLLKNMILNRLLLKAKMMIAAIVPSFLGLILQIALIAVPVVAVIAILYNSPFALFLPPLEDGDTVQSVTSAYMADFNRDINTLVNDHTDCEMGKIVYVGYEEAENAPSNFYDMMSVYMVKYGIEEIATVMDDDAKQKLKGVFDDMCSYTTSMGTEETVVTDEQGSQTVIQRSCCYVNVTLKNYHDMVSEYQFDSNQAELLEQMMSPEAMQAFGAASKKGGGEK